MKASPELPEEKYADQPSSLWRRIKDRLGWQIDDYYEEDCDDEGSFHQPALRLHAARANRVSVWLSVSSLENAQSAADGLKRGHQQIVNLEKASLEVTTRVIDFLSGVIYALDGAVQRVGDKVYLFTPRQYVIDVENGQASKKVNNPFHEN